MTYAVFLSPDWLALYSYRVMFYYCSINEISNPNSNDVTPYFHQRM